MRLAPLYDCRTLCKRCPGSEGDLAVRAASRCSLPGFDPARWDPAADPDAAADAENLAMDLVRSAASQGVEIDHQLDRDGCPWGWALSRYAQSVARYAGTRTIEDPRRSTSLWMQWELQRAGERPAALFEAVTLYEAHDDGAHALYHRARQA